MLNLIRILLFVLVNIAGWFTLQVVFVIAAKYGFNPNLPAADVPVFRWWYMTVGVWVWMVSALISVGYFFTENELKNWLLLAPMYITAIYSTGVLVYFNFFYNLA